MKKVYHKLIIDPQMNVDIWVADHEGHLVAKMDNLWKDRLLPGIYDFQFGLSKKSQKYRVYLSKDTEIIGAEQIKQYEI